MNPDLATSTRRLWVKQFMFGTAAALTGPAWTSRVVADVTPTGPGPGVLRIKVADYPALAAPGGSIQLQFIDYLKPLTLNRVTNGRFVTLDSICTHSQCTVGRFIVAQNRMRCPCHGSRYDIEGRVFRDASGNSTEPAKDDLNRFATHFDPASGIIAITIPDLKLHIESIKVQQQGENGQLRLKLTFPVSYGAIYEISYQPDLDTLPQVISYSKTATGIANQSNIGPEEEGSFTAYVDTTGPRGFFSVGVKLTPAS